MRPVVLERPGHLGVEALRLSQQRLQVSVVVRQLVAQDVDVVPHLEGRGYRLVLRDGMLNDVAKKILCFTWREAVI